MPKFSLERKNNIVRAESRGLFSALRRLSARAKITLAGGLLVSALSMFNPTQARADEVGVVDTTTQVGQEQVIDSNEIQNEAPAINVVPEAPVQQSTPVPEPASVQNVVPQEEAAVNEAPVVQENVESAPVVEQNVEQVETAVSQTPPTINEEIDQRVPQVNEGEQETVETNNQLETEETKSENTNDIENTNVEMENSAVEEVEPVVSQTPPTVNEEIDQRVPQVNESEQESVETDLNYQVVDQNGELIIVGDIPEDKLSQVLEDLTNQYGEEKAQGLTIFDYDTINSQMEYGETVQLGQSGYTATKHEDGSIEVKDADGNVIASWEGQEMDLENNQETVIDETQNVEQTEDGPTYSQDITVPDDYESKDYVVNQGGYLILKNSDGSYVIAMSSVGGLSNFQLQDLISRLQAEGVIPVGAKVIADNLPSGLDKDDIEQGKTSEIVQIGDFYFESVDGVNIKVSAEDEQNLTAIEENDEHIYENGDISQNPDAQIGENDGKPGHDDINPNEPEEPTDKPEEPTPEEPTPEEPGGQGGDETPEPAPEVEVSTGLPQMGDSSALAVGLAAAGTALAGAGLAGSRKRKKGLKDDKNNVNDLDDLESTAYEWADSDEKADLKDYNYDELLRIAEEWHNSEERKEWLQQSKGKTR